MPGFYRSGASEGDIITAVQSHARYLEERQDTQARFRQHDADEGLWRLDRYTLEEIALFAKDKTAHWPSVTLNGPRTLYNALRRAVTAQEPRFRMQLPGLAISPDDPDGAAFALEETARHERFVTGMFHAVDEQRIRRSEMTIQYNMCYHFAVRGGGVARAWYDPNRRYPFSVQFWDPRTVVYEPGLDGLSFACHHYRAPRYDVIERWQPKRPEDLQADADGNVEVYDAWWLEAGDVAYNTVFAPGCVLKAPAELPKQDHLPVFVVRMSGPDIEAVYDQSRGHLHMLDAWETIYTSNREVYRWLNRTATLSGIYLRNNAIGARAIEGKGLPVGTELEKAVAPFGLLTGQDIKISHVDQPSMAQEVKEFFSQMQGAEQRGGVPYSSYGQIPGQLSGFAINQLQGAVGILAQPLAASMSWMYRLIADELIQQFRARGKKVTLRGHDQRRQQFIEEIKRSDIRDKYFLEVDLSPELPSDKLQEAQVAQAWASVGIDPVTIQDEVLHVQDPRQTLRRSAFWKVFNMAVEAEMQMMMQQQAAMQQNGMAPPPQAFPPSFQDPSQGMTQPGGLGDRPINVAVDTGY